MSALWLDADELAELTRRKRWKAQVAMLKAMGVPYIERPGEFPAVLWADVRQRQDGTVKAEPRIRIA